MRFDYVICAVVLFLCNFACEGLGQTTSSVPPRTQSESRSALLEFERFVPAQAKLLLVHRPRQLAENEVINPLINSAVISSYPWLPGKPENIELVVAATSHKTFDQLMGLQAQAAFADIAADLAEAMGEQPHNKNTEPSLANYFNSEFCGLVKFTKPTGWNVFARWLDVENDNCGQYQSRQWMGHEILECGCDNCCIVLRMNEKTFVVGHRQHLGKALESDRPLDNKLTGWLRELQTSEFAGEFYIGTDISAYEGMWGGFLPRQGAWTMADKIWGIQFRLDLTHSPLVACQFEFQQPRVASEFKNHLESQLREQLTTKQRQLERTSDDSIAAWQARQSIELARSLTFKHQKSSVRVELPRPHNFDEMITKLVTQLHEHNRQQQKSFDEIAADLDAARNAARNTPFVKTIDVIILNQDLDAGQLIREEHFEIEQWPAKFVPKGAVKEISSVVGMKVQQDLYAGQPLLIHDVDATTNNP